MASLKDLKVRIRSVNSTMAITKTMKMVSVSKVRRAQENVDNSKPYVSALSSTIASICNNIELGHPLVKKEIDLSKVKIARFILIGSERGLCGGFNTQLFNLVKERIKELEAKGVKVQVVAFGRSMVDNIKRHFGDDLIASHKTYQKELNPAFLKNITKDIYEDYKADKFQMLEVFYNKFVNVLVQVPSFITILPFTPTGLQNFIDITKPKNQEDVEIDVKSENVAKLDKSGQVIASSLNPVTVFEPSKELLIDSLLPLAFNAKIYYLFLVNIASEHAARMTSMDNATRNAQDMIKSLSLVYNRTRQSNITNELIEIISGSEALSENNN